MNEETSLILSMPAMSIDVALQRRQAIVDFTKQVMVKGRDFGGVGGSKPTLLKPGAEKLSSLFGLWPDFEPVETIEDWTGNAHDEEPFFSYRYKCTMRRIEDNRPVGAGIGSCNSWERKYRFVKGKKRSNPQDIVNTIDKMAQKRALVAAVLIAVNASEFFTQDLEDYSNVVDGQWEPVTNGPGTTAKPLPPKPVAKKVEQALDTDNGNGNDIDHMATALLADNLQDFAEHAAAVLDGYENNFAVVGALVNKYPADHGLDRFVFGKTKQAEYMQWLADRKAEVTE